ncbi:MAG: glycosyltransferase [Micrococcales bacterium]|nr:glycosyltransferase [Micrococcales bacterium]
MPEALSVSVVVCSYTVQRWDQVGQALRAAAAQQVPPDELVLVVDHDDELAARARTELLAELGTLVVLTNEHARGLSGARNTALERATGDVVVFLDDDARPTDDQWLGRLLAPYDDPQVSGVGGPVHPVWPTGRRPATLPADPDGCGVLDWVVGCSFSGQPVAPGPVRSLMGCNMSLRRAQALAVGGFAEELGRVGHTPSGCEETELCIRITQSVCGARLVFDPAAAVAHEVAPDRLTWRYLRGRGYAEGMSKAVVSGLVGTDDALCEERSYVARVLPRAVTRGLRGVVAGPRRRRDHAASVVAVSLCLLATALGYLRGRAAGAPATTAASRRRRRPEPS